MREEKKNVEMIALLTEHENYEKGYESPISIIQDTINEIVEMHDNTIYMKVREIVDVDKEELHKALAYDRDQYNKGYQNGYRRGLEEGKQVAMKELANSILENWGDEDESMGTDKDTKGR